MSSLAPMSDPQSLTTALEWLAGRRLASRLQVRSVGLDECRGWSLVDGELRHRSGRYFQVVGTQGCDWLRGWVHPMVRQHEIGLLAFLVRPRDGTVEWLVQAKTEPGNTGGTQLAPTVQATQSNQDRAHGGLPVRYLELFTASGAAVEAHVVSDVLASEQGTRFLGKRNRNTILQMDPPQAPRGEGAWRWLDRAVIRQLLGLDFVLNTDARSVIATSPWRLLADDSRPFKAAAGTTGFAGHLLLSYETPAEIDVVLEELAARRAAVTEPMVEEIPLDWADGWRLGPDTRTIDEELTLVEVSVADREVSYWCQPLIAGTRIEACDLYAQVRDGVMRFLFRFAAEPGLRNVVELGPTVQTDRGREWGTAPAGDAVQQLSLLQSDEGSRFLTCVGRYRVLEVEPGQTVDAPDGVWLTLSQMEALAGVSGVFTNESRTLISLLLSMS